MRKRMRKTRRVAGMAAISIVVLGTISLAQSSNPHVGTWRLNVAKSKYNPGPGIKTGITTIEAAGAGVKYVVDQVAVDGTKRHWEFITTYDGKDTPVTGNHPDSDTVAATRINANSVQLTNKKNGKVTTTQTSVVSADGKTRTVTTKGTNGSGQAVNHVVIYERQ